MADESDNTISNRWNDVLADYKSARAAADAVAVMAACRVREQVFDIFADAVRAIQDAPAPDLTGLVEKLQVYWRAGDLDDGSYGSSFRRKIIGDLRRIEGLRAGIDDVDAHGGLGADQVAQDWAEAIRDLEHYADLVAKGSGGSGSNTPANLQVLLDDAEAALLSLPAPNVAGVIRKLEILWTDQDWFGSVADTSLHAGIMGELQRFAALERDQA